FLPKLTVGLNGGRKRIALSVAHGLRKLVQSLLVGYSTVSLLCVGSLSPFLLRLVYFFLPHLLTCLCPSFVAFLALLLSRLHQTTIAQKSLAVKSGLIWGIVVAFRFRSLFSCPFAPMLFKRIRWTFSLCSIHVL
ncbi:MAG: hypothetical protein RUDDFDWM_001661, partial [Candidatus Fervidibacterota bacterium]